MALRLDFTRRRIPRRDRLRQEGLRRGFIPRRDLRREGIRQAALCRTGRGARPVDRPAEDGRRMGLLEFYSTFWISSI